MFLGELALCHYEMTLLSLVLLFAFESNLADGNMTADLPSDEC